MYVNFAAKITREENERISSKFEEEKESNKRFRGEFGKTNERQNRICVRVCVCACTCPLFRSEARKTLVGRWTAAYKVPVPPIRKDSKVLRRNGTVAQIYVCTSGTEIEAAPNTHTFAIVSEFLRDLRSAQVYINYQARVYSAAFHAGIHSCGLTRIYICIVYIICLLSMFRFSFFFLRTLPCFVDKMDKNNHGVCITRKKKKIANSYAGCLNAEGRVGEE